MIEKSFGLTFLFENTCVYKVPIGGMIEKAHEADFSLQNTRFYKD
jgi:hypothetical protein